MTTRIRMVLVAATTISFVGTAGPAVAVDLGSAEDVRYAMHTGTLMGDAAQPSSAQLYTYCDSGWRALSGGQTVAARDRIAVSAPSGLDFWQAAAWHQSSVATTVTSYAVCLEGDDVSLTYEAQLDVAADSPVTGQASCQPGHAAVGGGLTSSAERPGLSLATSHPIDDATDIDTVPDDGWRSATQYSGPGGDNVVHSVMCVGGPRPAYRRKSVMVPASGSAKAQALCPKDRPTLGGGVEVSGDPDASHLVSSRPWDGGDAGSVPEDGWRGGVVNDTGSALTMTVHAICR